MSEELKVILYPALISGGIGVITIIVNVLLKYVDPTTKQQIRKEAADAWKEIAEETEARLQGEIDKLRQELWKERDERRKERDAMQAQINHLSAENATLRGQVQALQVENETLKSKNGNGRRGRPGIGF